jgi:hypothetical protein
MSNKDPEKEYSNLTDAIQFAFNQLIKGLYVSIPGIIQSYDPEKKRATVTPAIRILKTDNSTEDQQPIANVPVIWPSGGGFTLLFPLVSGDPVNIFFSQRGITKFKETYGIEDPGIGLLDKEDAYIIAGFGGLEVTPAVSDAMNLQDENGLNFLSIDTAGNALLKTVAEVIVEAPSIKLGETATKNIAVNGDATTVNSSHSHTIIASTLKAKAE